MDAWLGFSTWLASSNDMISRAQPTFSLDDDDGQKRWVIEGAGGSPKVVGSADEVRDLLDQGRISADSRVYEIVTAPRRLRDVPELRAVLAEPLSSEPPVRHGAWSDERAQLSEELAILDRPLDDAIEYYDEPTGSRPKRVVVGILALVIAGLGFGAYAARARPSWLLPRPDASKEQVVAVAAPIPSVSESPAAAAPLVAPPPLAAAAARPAIVPGVGEPARDKPAAGRRTSSKHQSGSADHARQHAHRHRL